MVTLSLYYLLFDPIFRIKEFSKNNLVIILGGRGRKNMVGTRLDLALIGIVLIFVALIKRARENNNFVD